MDKEKIINLLSFLIAIVAILLCLFYKDDLSRIGFIAGCGSFLYGLCMIINKNKYGSLLICGGISLSSTMLLFDFKILNRGDSLTFFVCLGVFFLMLISLLFTFGDKKLIMQKYTRSVEGVVTDLIKNPNTKKEFYQVVYSYNLNDNSYSVVSPGYVDKNIPKIGDKREILVDSKDDSDVYFEISLKDKIYNRLTVILLLIISLGIIVSLFVRR